MAMELYFLRSSEQKIVNDMLKVYYKVEDLKAHQELLIYSDFYGLSSKDLGLYALVDGRVAGAVWSRLLNEEDNSQAFIDKQTPIMHLVILEEFCDRGVESFMLEQFLQEAGALYGALSVATEENSNAEKLYMSYDFEQHSEGVMLKKLERREVIRPSDGYDASKWMD